ncbi:MAG: hypothetical protein M0R44_10930 [Candidatus Marinimicrobia bacterium]|jgi:chromosome segregation ATPase|nr:hypothetical protein [Candidatus Neomarinimicrobiota bacterium]
MKKPIEWIETVHQDITQTVRMTVTRTWTDKYGTPHREDKPPTFADLVAVLGLMPADERVAVVGPLIGDALALQWESALTAATARAEKAERERDEARDAARQESKMLVAMCDEAKKRIVELEAELDDAKKLAERLNQEVCRGPGVRPCGLLVDETIRMKQSIEKAERELERARVRLGAVPAEDVFAAARRVVAERDELRARVADLEVDVKAHQDRLRDVELNLQARVDWITAERDEAVKRPLTGADIIAALLAMSAEDRQQVMKVYESQEVDRWKDATNKLAAHRDELVSERNEATAHASRLESALGQAEKELHECRIALKEALGGLDSVKDQNADLRRQLRRLQTGTEIESDQLTDVELNLQARVDHITAERDEALRRAGRVADLQEEVDRSGASIRKLVKECDEWKARVEQMSACKAADPQVVTPAIIAAARDLLQASRAFNVAPDWVTTAQQTMEEALAAATQQRSG